jgi:signal transduction histidine kinase
MKAPESFPCTAHEILGPIRGYTSLIQDDNPPGSNTRWWADKIMRNVEAMEKHLALMDTLRRDAASAERTSWRDVIALAIGWVYHFGAGARIEIYNEAPTGFVGTRELLARALFHVVRNACEAAGPDGRVKVRVVERRAGNDGALDFDVAVDDNGPGIPREEIESVRRPFVTTKAGHAGLGLSYVESVAREIGMGVKIESGVGSGTNVTMKLRVQGGQW